MENYDVDNKIEVLISRLKRNLRLNDDHIMQILGLSEAEFKLLQYDKLNSDVAGVSLKLLLVANIYNLLKGQFPYNPEIHYNWLHIQRDIFNSMSGIEFLTNADNKEEALSKMINIILAYYCGN